jgi:uncharacterized protein (TIGR00369 family)
MGERPSPTVRNLRCSGASPRSWSQASNIIRRPDGLRRGLGRDGTHIPAYQTLGVEVRTAAAGSAVVRVPASAHLAAPGGVLLPGAFAVLADACCGCAIAAALPAGGAALTAQLRVEFIRPLPAGQAWIEGRAEADAVEDDSGLARAEIVDQADQLLAVASLRIIKASHQGFRQAAPAGPSPVAPVPAGAAAVVTSPSADLQPPATSIPPAPRHVRPAPGCRPRWTGFSEWPAD